MNVPLCRRLAWAIVLAVLWLGLARSACAAEEDVVYFSHGRLRSQTRLTGEVVDFTGKQLQIRVNGQVSSYATERVSHVEFRRQPEHHEADQLFAKRDFAEARNRYLRTQLVEGRRWVRRLLVSQVIWCYAHLQQMDSAGDTFLDLLADDPDTQYFDAIPLAWLPQAVPPLLENKARAWLDSHQPAAVLMGASHLVSTSQRAAAMDALRKLRLHADPRIAGLAAAQLWRAELATASPRELEEWREELPKIPEPLRAGAYYMLGSGLARNGQAQTAALSFLRVPVLYPRHRNLAARALLDAGRQLDKLGRRSEALRLYREIVADYPETRDAAEAKAEMAKP
jgi:tetratricopeptide (TPR) repeat protein